MEDNVRVVEEDHALEEVVDKRRDEDRVQLDVGVLQDVLQCASCAKVRYQHHAVRLHACADEAGKPNSR